MFSTMCGIVDSIANFFSNLAHLVELDMLFIIGLAVEVLLVLFFLIKSANSYEAALNRALDKLNVWLFEKKTVTEENIKDLNALFKAKAPKRVCYYWQQYILFREGNPSEYLSVDNLVEKPLKTSSYNSNIKNLSLFSTIWAFVVGMFVLISSSFEAYLTGRETVIAIMVPIFICIISAIFVAFLRARKNSVLNSLYQNVSLFGRFMDNACIDLPTYIDYQILFTPEEIEKGQPVLREFLDYKARKEKEEFNKAKVEQVNHEVYDFSSTGVDGSIVLDRAMRESELFMKKKEKILVKVSQLEAELDSRRKNFETVQKDSQTKIQASKENILRLRQMQEETTNRIESNYYRKQQTQEVVKQEQLEQEFEQQRAKYLLEKSEGEEEIAKLNKELAGYKADVENGMMREYNAFFDRFCQSAEKVVAKVFNDKINALKAENEKDKQYITELEIKLKNVPQGEFDASQIESPAAVEAESVEDLSLMEGQYDAEGNYVYPNGTFYDKDGNFHDANGNVYSQDGTLISQAEKVEEEPTKEEKQVVDFETFDSFDFMNDVSQKEDVYGVAENIIKDVDKDGEFEVVNKKDEPQTIEEVVGEIEAEKPQIVSMDDGFEDFALDVPQQEREESQTAEEVPVKKKAGRPRKVVEAVEEDEPVEKKKAGRPRKIVQEEPAKEEKRGRGRPKKVVEPEVVEETPAKKVGRPKKETSEVEQKEEPVVRKAGRPRKIVQSEPEQTEKKKAGRPRKIVLEEPAKEEKRGRGRPKKQLDSIVEINKKLSEEEAKLNEMRKALNKELENAMKEMDEGHVDDKQSRREELIAQIDALQKEAQVVVEKHQEKKISDINSRLEKLLDEIKKLGN